MIYENGTLKRILVDGGYYENDEYYFYLKDHLGNNRVVAKQDGTVVQTMITIHLEQTCGKYFN